MQTAIISSTVSTTSTVYSSNTPKFQSPLQRVVKGENNEALFNLFKRATDHEEVKAIITPRVDVAGYPYYWVGIRNNSEELVFKLLLTDQIGKYIYAYLKGDEELPTVTDFEPTETVQDVEGWLSQHQGFHFASAISYQEHVSMKEGMSYLTRKLIFKNGRINYPAIKYEDILNLLSL